MYFFTADEHYDHMSKTGGILKYRPFDTYDEMHDAMISRHNEAVGPNDIVIHAGDFTLNPRYQEVVEKFVSQLEGKHIFLKGSHDRWLKGTSHHEIWEKKIGDLYIVVCHYCMRVWPRSHYNSTLLFGHSHGRLAPIGKSYDIGVDANDFYPVPLSQIEIIMQKAPNNFNYIKDRDL